MRSSTHPPRRGPFERVAAWLVTGPIGHLYGVVADLAVFFARRLWRRLRGARAPAGGRGPS